MIPQINAERQLRKKTCPEATKFLNISIMLHYKRKQVQISEKNAILQVVGDSLWQMH